MYKISNISFFLRCGFLPIISDDALINVFNLKSITDLSPEKDTKDACEMELIEEGSSALWSAFSNITNGEQIVPLSGGYDSRAILAILIELGHANRTTAVTFGIPGSYDYEIGKIIAKKFGIKHRIFDLNDIKLEYNQLFDIAKYDSPFTLLFDAYYNKIICREFGKECTYWSGFVGPLHGTPIFEEKGNNKPYRAIFDSWDEAKKDFINYNLYTKSHLIIHPDHKPEKALPMHPIVDKSIMSYPDQINFALRQNNYIKRVVIFKGFDYKTPFLNTNWIRFVVNLPYKYRADKYFYKQILTNNFPDFYSLPTTNKLGKGMNISKRKLLRRRIMNKSRIFLDNKTPWLGSYLTSFWESKLIYKDFNYIDFSEAIRIRDDYNSIVRQSISDLKKRNIVDWVDIDSLFKYHLKKTGNFGRELILLTALEISFKSSENN